jgi:hypothetical protein
MLNGHFNRPKQTRRSIRGYSNILDQIHCSQRKNLSCKANTLSSRIVCIASSFAHMVPSRFLKLERAGISREIAISHDLSVVKHISDEEIRSAIEALEISTAAINQQNLTLKTQRDNLEAIIEESHHAESTRKRFGDRHNRKFALEKQHVQVAVSCAQLEPT